MEQEGRRLTLTVAEAWDGEKVDTLLRRELGLSGTVIKRVKWREDGILLDGVRAITGQRAAAGQILSVRVDEPERTADIPPEPGPLEVVYEDWDLLVVNKAPGVRVHPGPGQSGDTLCNHIAYYYRQRGERAGVHPVQRLDRGTSGLLVTAKHPHAQERLKRQLHTPDFRRIYRAVCDGIPEPRQGRVEAPIGRVDGSLIQRRVHMAWMGCPLTGDFLYGAENRAVITRPALHAAELFLTHPITGEPLHWTAPLPADMAGLLK